MVHTAVLTTMLVATLIGSSIAANATSTATAATSFPALTAGTDQSFVKHTTMGASCAKLPDTPKGMTSGGRAPAVTMLQGMRGGDAAWNKDMFSIEGMKDMSNIQVRFPHDHKGVCGGTRLVRAYLGPPTGAKGHPGRIVSV